MKKKKRAQMKKPARLFLVDKGGGPGTEPSEMFVINHFGRLAVFIDDSWFHIETAKRLHAWLGRAIRYVGDREAQRVAR